jgi:membrane protease YdiL (CAAX protease family)
MKTSHSNVRRWAAALFAALTVLLSFGAYLLPVPRAAVPFFIAATPAVVASTLVVATEGRTALTDLWASLSFWRIRFKWLAVTLVLGVGLRLAISLAALGLGLIPRLQWRAGPPGLFALLAVIFIIAAALEEVGWRGYALRRLLEQRSGLEAALLLGLPWGVLHLTLHLPGMEGYGMPPLATLLQLIGLSVVLAWVYVGSGRSVALVTLLHALWNFFGALNVGIPLVELNWLMAGVLVLAGATVTVWPGSGLLHGKTGTPASPPARQPFG